MAVRDRAAYMREYRARKRTEAPVLRQQVADLAARVDSLGARVDRLEALHENTNHHPGPTVGVNYEQNGRHQPAPVRRVPA